MSGAARAGLGLAYAAATVGAFPHPLSGHVVDGGLVLAWIAPALLLAAVRGLAPGRAAALGFAAGVAAYAGVLHWIYVVTVVYGHAPPAVGVVAPVLLATYIAAFSAAFAAGAAWFWRRATAGPLLMAAWWTALDHARSAALTGFPWATLGYALHGDAPLRGLASVTGVYGLSFAAVAGSAALLAALWPAAGFGGRWAAATALGVVVALHGLGAALAPPADPGGPRVRIAVVQGNIEQGVKWSPDWAERTLAIYESLTRRAADEGAQWVVWPETAVPGSPDTDPELRERLVRLARETGTALVVGAVGVVPRPGGEFPALYDSAYLIGGDGASTHRYDKAHLVPFGEYLPLRPLLGRFVRAVATGSAGRDVSAGDGPRALPLPLPGASGTERVLPVGVPICYELLFPDLVRRFAENGAAVLLAITNDAWYGRTGAPYQFLAITALRSAETGLWTARAANTGVSAFIDARGRVREQTAIFERDVRVAEVPLRAPNGGTTFYVRHGDVFAAGCWAALAGAALLAARRGRRRGRQEREGGA